MRTDFTFVSLSTALVLLSCTLSGGGISELCRQGTQKNPKILSLAHKTKASGYRVEQGYDRYKPQISISASGGYEKYEERYSYKSIEYSGHIYNYGVTVEQAIYRPRLLKEIQSSKLKKRAAQMQKRDEEARLTTMIAQTAIERIRLERIRELNKRKVELYRKAMKQIASKFSMRLSNSAELSQAKARLQSSIAQLARTKQMIMMTDANLKLLTKMKKIPQSIFKKRYRIDRVEREFKRAGIERFRKMIRENTMVRLSKLYVDIAEMDIEARRAERYPTLSMRVNYSSNRAADNTRRQNDIRGVLSVDFPFFQGGYVSDRVDEARELYLSASRDLDDRIAESEISLEKYWVQIKGGLQTYRAQKIAEKSAKTYFESMKNAYKQGLQSLTDAYIAEADYYNSIVERINSAADLLKAILNIYYIIGKADYKTIAKFEKSFLSSLSR